MNNTCQTCQHWIPHDHDHGLWGACHGLRIRAYPDSGMFYLSATPDTQHDTHIMHTLSDFGCNQHKAKQHQRLDIHKAKLGSGSKFK